MKRMHAFMLSLAITVLLFSDIHFIKNLTNRREHIIERVVDGDTIVLENNEVLRLANINSPEKSEPSSIQAIDFLKSFENHPVDVESLGRDKYKRTLARIYSPDYLNLELVKKGFAKKFLVDEKELKIFAEAESQAINNQKGIWQFSPDKLCIKVSVNPKEEIVQLSNFCNLNLANWHIEDESRKQFFFPKISSPLIKIHSLEGKNNKTDLYWNSKQDIWNNDRDSLYLFDSQNKLAGYYVYGY
jgi:endonuclease YncB( thermonuclease family)